MELNRYDERAITKEGLIKFGRGKHEKDDRIHISRKENYVLGWDNKEKISNLKRDLISIQESQFSNRKGLTTNNELIKI